MPKTITLGSAERHQAERFPGREGAIEIIAAARWSVSAAPVNVATVIHLSEMFTLQGEARIEAVLAFAREFGTIGKPAPFVVAPADGGQPFTIEAEPFDHWVEFIRQMWFMVGYLHALTLIELEDPTGDDWRGDHLLLLPYRLKHPPATAQADCVATQIGPRGHAWLKSWQDDCATRGYVPLPEQVKRRLRQAATMDGESPELPPVKMTSAEKTEAFVVELREQVTGKLRELVGGELRPAITGDDFPLRLELEPQTLRAALWMQVVKLLEAVREGKPVTYRKCRECQKPIALTGDRQTGSRADSELCSRACVQRAFRKRQQHARMLRSRGTTISEIVRTLGIKGHGRRSADDIVCGWCGEASEAR